MFCSSEYLQKSPAKSVREMGLVCDCDGMKEDFRASFKISMIFVLNQIGNGNIFLEFDFYHFIICLLIFFVSSS